jgi:DNA anti-recombination protein RmuC
LNDSHKVLRCAVGTAGAKNAEIHVSVFTTANLFRCLAAALFAIGISASEVRAADGSRAADAKKSGAASTAAERAKKASPAELRKLHDEVSKQRDAMIADFDALTKQMKDATEEKKKEIREKLEEQSRKFEEVTNALMKQIRDEQRKQRQNTAPGKR